MADVVFSVLDWDLEVIMAALSTMIACMLSLDPPQLQVQFRS